MYKTTTINLTKKHHDIVRKVARKLKVSQSEVIRRRITTFEEMLKELEEDMKHGDYIDYDRV